MYYDYAAVPCPRFGTRRLFHQGPGAKQNVIAYIANQETHHRKVTFREEFRSFLTKHGIRFDERYVGD